MVEQQPSKLMTRVRFPSPAPDDVKVCKHMPEKLRRTKSPRQRKEEAYANEHRYCYEYRNAAVRLWAKRKKRNQRQARHKVRQLAAEAAAWGGEQGVADRLADGARVLGGLWKLRKAGVLTLRHVIERKRATGRRPIY